MTRFRTRYQRQEAACQLGGLLRDRAKTPEVREIGQMIVVLLAAPAGLRAAAEPDVIRIMERYGLAVPPKK